MQLFLPAADTSLSFKTNPRYTLTLIPGKDSIMYYTNELASAEQVSKTAYTGLKKIITAFKQSAGDSTVVIIKPAEDAGYKNVVDVLDQMTINHIKRYALLDLTAKEEKILGIKGFMSLQEAIYPDLDVKEKTIDPVHDLVFYIEDDGLWYSVSGNSRDKAVRLAPATKENIVQTIGQIENKLNKKATEFIVIVEGKKSLKYEKFQQLIDAMKEKDLRNFQFITKD